MLNDKNSEDFFIVNGDRKWVHYSNSNGRKIIKVSQQCFHVDGETKLPSVQDPDLYPVCRAMRYEFWEIKIIVRSIILFLLYRHLTVKSLRNFITQNYVSERQSNYQLVEQL